MKASKRQHTPEPWQLNGETHIVSSEGLPVAWANHTLPHEAAPANARRIVACVNELAGKPEGYVNALEAQRDGLAAALRLIADQPREGDIPQQVVRIQRIARTALGKLNGG